MKVCKCKHTEQEHSWINGNKCRKCRCAKFVESVTETIKKDKKYEDSTVIIH